MKTDVDKTRDELLHELKNYRENAVETDLLRKRLKIAESECLTLEKRLEERDNEFSRECAEHSTAVKALGMAQLIVDQSPVVLFRRKAGIEPNESSLEYISANLRQFGYTPEEFFNGEII